MGIPARHELVDTGALCRNVKFFAIFEVAGWTEYFQRLNGFHTKTTLQFILNLTDTHSQVRGVHIDVAEVIVVRVIGFPQVGRSWFEQKTQNATAVRDFLAASEHVQ